MYVCIYIYTYIIDICTYVDPMLHCTPTLPTSKHNDLGSEECQGTLQSRLHIPTVIHLGRVFSEKNAKVLLEWSSEKYGRGAYRGDTTGNAQRLFEWSSQKYAQKQHLLSNRGHSNVKQDHLNNMSTVQIIHILVSQKKEMQNMSSK